MIVASPRPTSSPSPAGLPSIRGTFFTSFFVFESHKMHFNSSQPAAGTGRPDLWLLPPSTDPIPIPSHHLQLLLCSCLCCHLLMMFDGCCCCCCPSSCRIVIVSVIVLFLGALSYYCSDRQWTSTQPAWGHWSMPRRSWRRRREAGAAQ